MGGCTIGGVAGVACAAAIGVALCLVAACEEERSEVVALPSLPEAGAPAAPAAPDGGALAPPALDAGAFGFRRDVYPVFVEYCGGCHSVNGPYHDIASPDQALAYADAVEFAERIVARIEQGNMPPACVFDESACVPEAALATIERWIASGLPE